MTTGNTVFIRQMATLVVIIQAKHTDLPRDTAAVLTQSDEIMTFQSKCSKVEIVIPNKTFYTNYKPTKSFSF